MRTRIMTDAATTRRAFLGSAAALAAGAVVPGRVLGGEAPLRAAAVSGKPNSVFNGVRIGCITYSYRGGINSAEDTLKALIEDGLSEVELMGGPIQAYAGLGGARARGRRGGPAEQPATPTDAQRQTQLAKCRELRKMYNDAGVNIHIHKIGFGRSDEEIEFNFRVAKALGCVGITTERSEALAERLAPFADKHRIWVAFHNHTNNYPVMDKTDPILSYGQYIGFNFDVGHYFAGTKGLSPIPVIEKYHDRIVSLHLKDRTADGGNLPWGQGETPIKEILQLMRKQKWTFPADIELEYKIPQGSNSVAEVAKCVQYCKEALA
ncbi:MAG: sugar phosphate isomerase/epimerase [Pirellulales bacterium]|nr:sugar phosphate isomerase/epimerase [Pirellulales bacterium]